MKILQKICFVLLIATLSSVYAGSCFDNVPDINDCRGIAEQGDARAQYNLGMLYGNGEGVPQGYVMANMYSNIDSVNGDKDSVRNRDEGAKKTTSSQIERVENLVMEWMERAEYLVMEWVEKAEDLVMEWERIQGKLEDYEDREEITLIIIVVTIIFLFYFFRIFKKRNLERDYKVYFFRDLKKRYLERDYQEQEQLRQKREREKEQVHQEQERQERKRKEREKQEREEKVRLEEERRERQRQRQKQSSQKREPPKNRNEKERSYEEILGLSSGWTKSDLISAYRKKCQQTHPDKWKGYPENIVRAMEKEYKEVQNTFKYLSKK
jgi:DNA repair exonuclease SbcCD ATPase subunit